MAGTSPTVSLPDKPRGRPSQEYYDQLERFARGLEELQSGLDFAMSARGWAYYLENEGEITKSEIDYAENIINRLRKEGRLPLDFTAKDDSRKFHCVETATYDGPADYLKVSARGMLDPHPDVSFWEHQDCFIQVLVEKVDLVELFKPICREYNIPIATAKGWSTLRQRGQLLTRFFKWARRGKRPVLLYCGDFDPAGRQISENLRDNLADLKDARIPNGEGGYVTECTPEVLDLTIDRFGLNRDIIDEAGLTWIDNLETSGGGPPLDDPRHKEHDQDYVQWWLDNVGARKVEANALVTEPELGRELFRDTVAGYLGADPEEAKERAEEEEKKRIQNLLSEHDLADDLEAFYRAMEERAD